MKPIPGNEPADDDYVAEGLPRRPSWLMSWPSFFVLAFVVYELTAQEWLGITLFCIKFGWEDFRTALWLRRRDADVIRAKIGFWTFASSGLWRAAICGVALMFVVAALHGRDRNPGQAQPPPPQFIEAITVAFFGFL